MDGERAAISRTTGGPVTASRLRSDLHALGLLQGERLLVHASLSALGFVPGGVQTVLQVLMDVVGPSGLLAMPAFTTGLTDPAGWRNPAVPEDWIEPIRAETPVYDPYLSPSRGVGAISEAFRTAPGVVRSVHPQVSFAAWGTGAEAIVAPHELNAWMGETSPLARLYDVDAHPVPGHRLRYLHGLSSLRAPVRPVAHESDRPPHEGRWSP